MLTRYDEFLCHQTVDTFDSVATSAREWTERIWLSVHDISGEYQLVAGFGHYPNRNIMDAFACFVVGGKVQHCLRASRALRPGFDRVRVGPFSYEIIEPLVKIRLSVGRNDHGLEGEIDFIASMPPHEEDAQFNRTRGRVLEHVKRYVQVGRPEGWITAGGRRVEINGTAWRAERDHSWGIRRGGGVPETGVQPGEVPAGYLYNFLLGQFDGWGVTYHLREEWDSRVLSFSGAIIYPDGSGKKERTLAGVRHDFTFRPDARQINGGSVTLIPGEDDPVEVSVRPLSTCHIRAGGYFGFRGFTHGLWMGEEFCDGFTLDLTDIETFREVSFLEDFMCELRCGNEVGYGIVELVLIGKYPRYGYLSY